MVKAYLRYEATTTFGVVSSNCNLIYDATGRHLLSAALEDVALWNIKQGSLVQKLSSQPNFSGRVTAEVTQLAHSPAAPVAAAGHADGTVRLWNLQSGLCDVTFSGHRGAITVLLYSRQGALLASGAQDTEVVVWDVAGETGLYRLRGHTDQITGLVFSADSNRLISSSKDSHIRVWDLGTQRCVQTVVGQHGEVWSLALNSSGDRLAVGTASADLQLYHVLPADDDFLATNNWLVPLGTVRRQASERVSSVQFSPSGSYLACCSAGRVVELLRVLSSAEVAKKAKRRKSRKKEKGKADDDAEEPELVASDEMGPWQILRTQHKVRSLAWHPGGASKDSLAQLALGLANNSMEVWDLRLAEASRSSVIEAAGHRSDVRAVVLSSDDSLLLSASSSMVKVWNPHTQSCLRTIETGYGLCAVFAPGSRHAVLGTKAGRLELLDVGAAARLCEITAHEGAVWSMAALPDSSGFVSGSADYDVKFWEWELVNTADSARQLGIRHTRTLKMTDDVLCVRVSPNGKLLAVALLDSTIKVFFTDTLKFFLSLYGHKLPVLSMDISSDSALLVSGSADKNIKIWGLDFGDCHRSLFAHADSVMQVAFVRNTHYVFTVGKDRVIKYWDADKWELLLTLEGHHGEVWCLAVSALGDFLITGSHDRSLRRWDRTQEAFFVEEEREKRLDSLFEADAQVTGGGGQAGVSALPVDGQVVAVGAAPTSTSVNAADSLMDALELAAAEAVRQEEHERQANGGAVQPFPPNPLLLGLMPGAYVLRALASVRAGDLEQALMLLPFSDALRLLGYLAAWSSGGTRLELTCRVAGLLMRIHHVQLVATPSARPTLITLQTLLRKHLKVYKDAMGFNLAALTHLQHVLKQRSQDLHAVLTPPVKRLRDS